MPPSRMAVRGTSIAFMLAWTAISAPDAATTKACADIQAMLPDKLSYSHHLSYYRETQNYWSSALRQLKPACIVQATSAIDVSKVVKLLGKPESASVKFVVKSGGHNPNPGMSSCDDCVLIALNKMQYARQDHDRGVAEVGPGGTWADVAKELDKEGVQAVGGRVGAIGVGGLLSQGGLSFLSAQYGMATDNIVGYETVMANGSIINVDMQNNPELMQAMRGSGDQFGIHTKYTLKTYRTGKVWGGMRVYSDNGKAKRFELAFHEFVANNAKDPKAAIIVNRHTLVGGTPAYSLIFFYDGAKPPKAAFGQLLDIPSLIDLTSTQSYGGLIDSLTNGAGQLGAIGYRINFRTVTIPYIADQPLIYNDLFEMWENVTRPYFENHRLMFQQIVLQPMPTDIARASDARGRSAWGLGANDKHRIVIGLNQFWWEAAGDKILADMGARFVNEVKTYYARVLASKYKVMEGGNATAAASAAGIEEYLPLYMNDAAKDQDVTRSYRRYENFARLQRMHDPNGLWKRSGGFKY